MFRNFFLRRMMKSQLKDVPAHEQDKMIAMVQKNPELFQKIALEVQEKMKQGKDQMAATMEVMQAHKEELQKLM